MYICIYNYKNTYTYVCMHVCKYACVYLFSRQLPNSDTK